MGVGKRHTALLAGNGGRLDLSGPTLGYGIVAGLLLTVSNLSLIESLRHIDAGLGSTVYRLNTVGVVVLSVLLLGEPIGAAKVTGVTLGILAVLLLAIERGEASIVIPVANMSFVIALLLSVGFGMEGLTSRKLAAVAVSVGAIAALSLA